MINHNKTAVMANRLVWNLYCFWKNINTRMSIWSLRMTLGLSLSVAFTPFLSGSLHNLHKSFYRTEGFREEAKSVPPGSIRCGNRQIRLVKSLLFECRRPDGYLNLSPPTDREWTCLLLPLWPVPRKLHDEMKDCKVWLFSFLWIQ